MNTQTHRTLGAIVKQTEQLAAVRKNDLRFGDRVVVTTCNSTYSIHVLKNGQYAISGGWVDKEGLSPLRTHISGYTWVDRQSRWTSWQPVGCTWSSATEW